MISSQGFSGSLTTAHVLTEVSNLAGRLEGAQKNQIFAAFAATLEVFGEETVPSYAVAQRSEFPFLGLTDSVLAAVSQEFLIVSHDAVMIDLLRLKGIEALKWVEVLGLAG